MQHRTICIPTISTPYTKWLCGMTLISVLGTGCPVEPKDMQDISPEKPGQAPQKPGQQNMGQQNMGGANGVQGPNGGQGQNAIGMQEGPSMDGNMDTIAIQGQPPSAPNGNDGNMPPTGEQTGPMPDNTQVEGIPTEGIPLDAPPMVAGHEPGEVTTPDGRHPTPNFEHQPGEIPKTAGDVLPLYQTPPSFADFTTGETITITLEVTGASSFDLEFIVKREGEGRVYPKVIHKQSNVTSPVQITAPATMKEGIWLVITADATGNGPTPDDLVGGTTEAILLLGKDFTLSYTLSANEQFLQQLPWFSQAVDGPSFQ